MNVAERIGDMMKKYNMLILLLILSAINPLFAQNYLFQNGQSGFHLRGTYSEMGYPLDEFNTGIGYTLNGSLSINLYYRQWDFTLMSDDDNIHFIGGGLDYLLIKQDKFPVSVSFGASYLYSRNIVDRLYDMSVIEQQDTMRIYDADLVAGVHRRFDLNNKLTIIPSLTLGVTKRVFNSTNSDVRVQDPVQLIYVGSFKADLIFRFLDVFAGIDYNMTQRSFHYHLGIGILLKHKGI